MKTVADPCRTYAFRDQSRHRVQSLASSQRQLHPRFDHRVAQSTLKHLFQSVSPISFRIFTLISCSFVPGCSRRFDICNPSSYVGLTTAVVGQRRGEVTVIKL